MCDNLGNVFLLFGKLRYQRLGGMSYFTHPLPLGWEYSLLSKRGRPFNRGFRMRLIRKYYVRERMDSSFPSRRYHTKGPYKISFPRLF